MFSMVVIGGLGSLPGVLLGAAYVLGRAVLPARPVAVPRDRRRAAADPMVFPGGLGARAVRHARLAAPPGRQAPQAGRAEPARRRARRGTSAGAAASRRPRRPPSGPRRRCHDRPGPTATTTTAQPHAGQLVRPLVRPHDGRRGAVPARRAVRAQRGRRARPHAFGVLLPDIRDDFGLDTQGILTVVAFAWSAALILALPIGFFADRFNRVPSHRRRHRAGLVLGPDRVRRHDRDARHRPRRARSSGRGVNDPVHNSLLADYYDIRVRPRVYAVHRSANAVGQLSARCSAASSPTSSAGGRRSSSSRSRPRSSWSSRSGSASRSAATTSAGDGRVRGGRSRPRRRRRRGRSRGGSCGRSARSAASSSRCRSSPSRRRPADARRRSTTTRSSTSTRCSGASSPRVGRAHAVVGFFSASRSPPG